MTDHTPLPWQYHRGEDYIQIFADNQKNKNLEVCEFHCYSDECESDVAIIVRAVNSHSELVEALKLADSHIEHMAARISKNNNGYSFESLGEDSLAIKSALKNAGE